METPFRDTLSVVRADLAVARARHAAAIERAGKLIPVMARRVARSLFGLGLILAAVVLVGVALLPPRDVALTPILIAGWPIAAALGLVSAPPLIWGLGRWLRWRAARYPVGPRPGPAQEDPHAALEALQAEPGADASFAARVAGWETAGLALPLIGLCLIVPLSLHLMVWATVQAVARVGETDRVGYWANLCRFDDWIRMSMVLVGLAHLALVISVFIYLGRLRRQPSFRPPSPFMPFTVAVLSSAFPGIVFIFFAGAGLLPPLIAAVTGVVFIPPIFGQASRIFWRERDLLEEWAGSSRTMS